MPFDAARAQTIEMRLIDETLKILGPNGEHWMHGDEDDGRGNYCMWGAIRRARKRYSPAWKDDLEARIAEAIWQGQGLRYHFVVPFNDALGTTFTDVRNVLELAKVVTPTKETREILHCLKTATVAAIWLYGWRKGGKPRDLGPAAPAPKPVCAWWVWSRPRTSPTTTAS
jgi:hypothetical protein